LGRAASGVVGYDDEAPKRDEDVEKTLSNEVIDSADLEGTDALVEEVLVLDFGLFPGVGAAVRLSR
jgi:hypothetical protein